jgi:hypothetical protein
MTMKGRAALGVTAGVLLAVGLVSLAGVGGFARGWGSEQTPASSATTVTSAGQGPPPTNGQSTGAFSIFGAGSGSPSRVSAIASNPAPVTVLALLPLAVALGLGLSLYSVSGRRNREGNRDPE